MADPVENAPMLTVNTLTLDDRWIFRAVNPRENTLYIMGEATYDRAYKAAQILQAQGHIVEVPQERGKVKWIP